MTVRNLASLLCLSDGRMICEWENGVRLPGISYLVFLSEIFFVTIDEILVRDR